jgi:hypothetical protein
MKHMVGMCLFVIINILVAMVITSSCTYYVITAVYNKLLRHLDCFQLFVSQAMFDHFYLSSDSFIWIFQPKPFSFSSVSHCIVILLLLDFSV